MITTDADTTTATPRVSAHSMCDHPRTKAARAACRKARRSDWIAASRGTTGKGDTVRIHTADDVFEGVLLGWGAKRIVVRVEDERITMNTADALSVEARRADADVENDD